jgi:hypothetical protein
MQDHFSFLADLSDASTLKEAAALYLDPRNRFLSSGPEALTETEAISLVLGERDYHLATRLLVSFGSLTALSRADLAQLSPLLAEQGLCASLPLFGSARSQVSDNPKRQ